MKLNEINFLVVILIITLITTQFINSATLRNKKKNKNEIRRSQEKTEPDANGFTGISQYSSIITSGGSTLLERNRDEKREERRKLAMNKDDGDSDEEEKEDDDEKKDDEVTTTIAPQNGDNNKRTTTKNGKNSYKIHKLNREKELDEINDEFARKAHLNNGGRNKRSDEIHSLGRAKELDETNEIVNAKPKTENNRRRSIKNELLKRVKKFDENNLETTHSNIEKEKKNPVFQVMKMKIFEKAT
uniref:Uncharacterized protein n=1 Tax=Strongyloides venezuelensis TaxID=75913 RepID=A0A0K0EWX3_STRVS